MGLRPRLQGQSGIRSYRINFVPASCKQGLKVPFVSQLNVSRFFRIIQKNVFKKRSAILFVLGKSLIVLQYN